MRKAYYIHKKFLWSFAKNCSIIFSIIKSENFNLYCFRFPNESLLLCCWLLFFLYFLYFFFCKIFCYQKFYKKKTNRIIIFFRLPNTKWMPSKYIGEDGQLWTRGEIGRGCLTVENVIEKFEKHTKTS
jgi:hypothetical protein